mmetsp:Transcript_6971/g.42674  ORF Transcript_6971/g.42674 Transcript_6971/m.42674 type:complete len:472 (+) Transcript_6971:254-1669(+)
MDEGAGVEEPRGPVFWIVCAPRWHPQQHIHVTFEFPLAHSSFAFAWTCTILVQVARFPLHRSVHLQDAQFTPPTCLFHPSLFCYEGIIGRFVARCWMHVCMGLASVQLQNCGGVRGTTHVCAHHARWRVGAVARFGTVARRCQGRTNRRTSGRRRRHIAHHVPRHATTTSGRTATPCTFPSCGFAAAATCDDDAPCSRRPRSKQGRGQRSRSAWRDVPDAPRAVGRHLQDARAPFEHVAVSTCHTRMGSVRSRASIRIGDVRDVCFVVRGSMASCRTRVDVQVSHVTWLGRRLSQRVLRLAARCDVRRRRPTTPFVGVASAVLDVVRVGRKRARMSQCNADQIHTGCKSSVGRSRRAIRCHGCIHVPSNARTERERHPNDNENNLQATRQAGGRRDQCRSTGGNMVGRRTRGGSGTRETETFRSTAALSRARGCPRLVRVLAGTRCTDRNLPRKPQQKEEERRTKEGQRSL